MTKTHLIFQQWKYSFVGFEFYENDLQWIGDKSRARNIIYYLLLKASDDIFRLESVCCCLFCSGENGDAWVQKKLINNK